ncbi:MAG: DUF1684 domain-containing protein [Flavobacteriaceae bacterium]|nr:DUF1684 domain-containing protein [Flavobacteriaceae bacterium]
MKITLFILSVCFVGVAMAQQEDFKAEVQAFQENYEAHYTNPETSPYKENTHLFKGHQFFPVDEKYRVEAEFYPKEASFTFATSTSRLAEYTQIGILKFRLNGKPYQLSIFYDDSFLEDEEYANKAFVPFLDETNGDTTYTNGRYCYVQLPMEAGEVVILDFNQSTNPYCAYVSGYSCAVPPEENTLDTKILAGIKTPK